MHAFIATVPITLLMAINYVVSYEIKNADVYITKSFSNAEAIASRLQETHIFSNVYVVENVLLTYPITIKKCYEMVRNGRKVVRELSERKYDHVYYNNSGWLINSIFYTGFLKGNTECEQHFIEHGYNTYLNEYGKKPWYLRLLINLCGYKCMDGSMIKELHMYNPQLLKVHQVGEIRTMPYMDKDNELFINAINKVFDFDHARNEFADKDIYIMEQGPLKVELDMTSFWEKVLSVVDVERAIVKAHPRQKNSALQNAGIAIANNNSIPWEVIALNTNMKIKTQLAIFSGSCINPKNFCNIESRVIFLYKLLPVDYSFIGKDVVELTDEIGASYSDPNMFFVPNTFEELRQYCIENNLGRR